MFAKSNLAAAILAFMLFCYAQLQGWSPFDNDAHSGNGHGSSSSSRTYHK